MEFVSFEIAKKLKEKGFKEECLCHYIGEDLYYNIESPITNKQMWFSHNKFNNIWHRDNYDAPTISQVLKWLREERGYNVNMRIYSPDGWYWTIQDREGNPCSIPLMLSDDLFETYEETAIAGIEYVLDNLI